MVGDQSDTFEWRWWHRLLPISGRIAWLLMMIILPQIVLVNALLLGTHHIVFMVKPKVRI